MTMGIPKYRSKKWRFAFPFPCWISKKWRID